MTIIVRGRYPTHPNVTAGIERARIFGDVARALGVKFARRKPPVYLRAWRASSPHYPGIAGTGATRSSALADLLDYLSFALTRRGRIPSIAAKVRR